MVKFCKVLILFIFICFAPGHSWAQTNHEGINRFIQRSEELRLGWTNRIQDSSNLSAKELADGYRQGHEGPKAQTVSKAFIEMYQQIEYAKQMAPALQSDLIPESLKHKNGSLPLSQVIEFQEKIEKLDIPLAEKNKLHLSLFDYETQQRVSLQYIDRQKFFVKKHLLDATYRYPGELMHFMLANLAVMYGECFGISSSVTFYKAAIKDPVCVQNLMELFSDPLFYGGFFAFMVGNGYVSPQIERLASVISDYRVRRGKEPFNEAKAKMWAGQIGMAAGFLFDQIFHKVFGNQYLKKCAAQAVEKVLSGKDSLNQEQANSESTEVDVDIFNDDKRYCVRAYRQIFFNKGTRDELTSGVLSLSISAYANGKITPKALGGIAYAYNWGVSKLGGIYSGLIISKKTPVLIKFALRDAKRFSKKYQIGFHIGRAIPKAGTFFSKTANLGMFLALSKIVAYYTDPFIKSITSTFDFKADVRAVRDAFKAREDEIHYDELKCPYSYDEGKVIEATGHCSKIPLVAELHEFHDTQKSWRQKKVLGNFNFAYSNWQSKWTNFHTHFKATKEILQEISRLREFEQTEKIQSIEETIGQQDQQIEELFSAASEKYNIPVEDLKNEIIEIFEDKDRKSPNEDYAYLRYRFGSNFYRKKDYEKLNLSNPISFRDSEKPQREYLGEDISSQGFFENMDLINNALVQSTKVAIQTLPKDQIDAYKNIFNRLARYNQTNDLNISSEIKDWLFDEARQSQLKGGPLTDTRINRAKQAFYALHSKVLEIEKQTWIDSSGTNLWWGIDQIKGQSPMDPELLWDFIAAKETFIETYQKLKASDNPYSYDFGDELYPLSYALMVFKKLSNISPITPAKNKMNKALTYYFPVHKYSLHLLEIQEAYASLPGDYLILDGLPEEDKPSPPDEEERAEKFWNKYHYAPPEPFYNSPDLFDFVLTSALCDRRQRYHWSPITGALNAAEWAFEVFFPEPDEEEGWSLEFRPPRLTNINYCERAVYLDQWHSQTNMSVKNSLFLSKNSSDEPSFEYWGLQEVAIYERSILEDFNTEKSFVNWWNENIYYDLIPKIYDQKQGFFEMVDTYLLREYSDTDPDELFLAVAGMQSETTWEFPGMHPLDAWLTHVSRDLIANTTMSFFSKEIEHKNFKQDENLLLAFANEFGILSNYLLELMLPIALSAEVRALPEQTGYHNEAYGHLMENKRNYVEIQQHRDSKGNSVFLVPEELLEFNTQAVVNLVSSHIKNIKFLFVNLLLSWDRLENKPIFMQQAGALRGSLNALASILLADEAPLRRAKELAERQDHLILYEDEKNFVPSDSVVGKRYLKMKPMFVIFKYLDGMIHELELLQRQRFGDSFGFDKILEDYEKDVNAIAGEYND